MNNASSTYRKYASCALLLFLFVRLSLSLTLQVEPKVIECFYEQVPTNTEMTLYYQVVRGGLLDIKLTVSTINKESFLFPFFQKPTHIIAKGGVSKWTVTL